MLWNSFLELSAIIKQALCQPCWVSIQQDRQPPDARHEAPACSAVEVYGTRITRGLCREQSIPFTATSRSSTSLQEASNTMHALCCSCSVPDAIVDPAPEITNTSGVSGHRPNENRSELVLGCGACSIGHIAMDFQCAAEGLVDVVELRIRAERSTVVPFRGPHKLSQRLPTSLNLLCICRALMVVK